MMEFLGEIFSEIFGWLIGEWFGKLVGQFKRPNKKKSPLEIASEINASNSEARSAQRAGTGGSGE